MGLVLLGQIVDCFEVFLSGSQPKWHEVYLWFMVEAALPTLLPCRKSLQQKQGRHSSSLSAWEFTYLESDDGVLCPLRDERPSHIEEISFEVFVEVEFDQNIQGSWYQVKVHLVNFAVSIDNLD